MMLCDLLDDAAVAHRVVADVCDHLQVCGGHDIMLNIRIDPKLLAIALLVVLLPKHAHLGQASMVRWVDALCQQVGVARAAPREEEVSARAAQAALRENQVVKVALTDAVVRQVRAWVLMSPVLPQVEADGKHWGPC